MNYRQISVQERNQAVYGTAEYLADDLVALESIPMHERRYGVTAYCISEMTNYIADSQGNWHKFLDTTSGLVGERGEKGEQGDIGPEGPQGEQGESVVGPRGPAGFRGLTGLQGIQGPPGEQGIQGEKGDTGEVGPQGPQGNTGPKGEKGDPGIMFIVDEGPPDINTIADFYIDKLDKAFYGPKLTEEPLVDVSIHYGVPTAYDFGRLMLGLKVKIKASGSINMISFYRLAEESTTSRKLKIWAEDGNELLSLETNSENIVSGRMMFGLPTPLNVAEGDIITLGYAVDGVYPLKNPMPEPAYDIFEIMGSGWSDNIDAMPIIQPTPDIPYYFIDLVFSETPLPPWEIIGYLSPTPLP